MFLAPSSGNNLDRAMMTLSKVSMPKQQNVVSLEMPSEKESHTMREPIFEPNTYDTTSDDYSVSDADS